MRKYVNMTDIISDITAQTEKQASRAEPDRVSELALVELLFFAYRDFVSEPDAVLADYEFGRAHHRVLHFVNRHPGIRVADLLDILRITKQSLARVLKQLIAGNFIIQRTGDTDRRQRLLYTTESGKALARRLVEMQSRRIRGALAAMPGDQRNAAAEFLRGIVDADERDKVARLIGQ
jgi:DNA-binding MarR family transcriptional regulator